MAEIIGVLLAAGSASRFGAHKLLTVLDGRPLIDHSTAALTPCDRVVAVVRDEDDALKAELQALGLTWIINPQPARGMGASIACAVRATRGSAGWCILPADMPRVTAGITAEVVAALRGGAPLAAPFCQGRRGHPVGFSAGFEHELGQLDGDIGGRTIVERQRASLTAIATDDPGVLRDVDTRADLSAAGVP